MRYPFMWRMDHFQLVWHQIFVVTCNMPSYDTIQRADPAPNLEPISRNSRKLFGPENPFLKLRPAYSVKLVFWYVVKGITIKITAKFRATRRLCFAEKKRIMSPEMHPNSFGTFETGPWANLVALFILVHLSLRTRFKTRHPNPSISFQWAL